MHRVGLIAFLALLTCGNLAPAVDVVEVDFRNEDGEAQTIQGRLLVEAADGGVLIETRDGRFWSITPDQLVKRKPTDASFQRLTSEQLGQRLLPEAKTRLPDQQFEVVKTKHYVICTSAGRKYAEWCGELLERLFRAFLLHWKQKKVELSEPAHPLPIVILANRQQFAQYATADEGPSAAESQGYYSIKSNRVVLFDLTATSQSAPAKSTAEINRKIAASPFNVATVVHEATHQIAFNSGMHTRMADNPLWVTEGMAMYFETPDLRSRSGWRTIGKPNRVRSNQLKDAIRKKRRSSELFTSILSEDKPFLDAKNAADSYAEAWALTYFVIKTRREQYSKYIKRLQEKKRLFWDKPEDRLREFEECFEAQAADIEKEYLRYMRRFTR